MILARPVRLMIRPTTVTPATNLISCHDRHALGAQKGITLAPLKERVQDKALGAC